MRNLLLSILLIYSFAGFSQYHKASISISGITQKRIDKYSKTYKIKKRHDTESLGLVDIKVHDEDEKLILKSKSNSEGKYDIHFELDPNESYMLSFYKNGYFLKQFLFNTNGISINKKIKFEQWDFYLYKRVIGLNDSIFNLPIIFYYDSERGYMTYDEEVNTPLTVNQENIYIEYLRNLNETNFTINETKIESRSTNDRKTTTVDNDSSFNNVPFIELINMAELLQSIASSSDKNSDSLIEQQKDKITGQWQQLEIAKAKAVTKEDKNRIIEAEKLLKEKESQIEQAQYEIANAKKQIELQGIDNKNKTQLLILGGIALAIVFALLLLVYRNNKERVKVNKLLTRKNEEVLDSIKYAKRLQNAILPPLAIIQKNLLNSFILYKPKDIVSGDFYWVENIGNKVLFAVVDCTGHGVPGAFMSIVAYNSLNEAINQHKLSKPSDILNQVNISITKTLHQSENTDVEDGMDISLCLLDTITNELEYAGAHHPLYIVSDGELTVFKSNNFSIGSQKGKDKAYNNQHFKLKKGDTIYIFSDGYVDQFGGLKDKKFMNKNFKRLILEIQSKSMAQQKEILHSSFMDWKKDSEQVDDVCVMGVKI